MDGPQSCDIQHASRGLLSKTERLLLTSIPHSGEARFRALEVLADPWCYVVLPDATFANGAEPLFTTMLGVGTSFEHVRLPEALLGRTTACPGGG